MRPPLSATEPARLGVWIGTRGDWASAASRVIGCAVTGWVLGGAAGEVDGTLGDTGVVAFGRDLEVTYRVWSPKAGYPGHAAYRDFHTWAHEVGLKASRVTGKTVEPPGREGAHQARREPHLISICDFIFIKRIAHNLVEQFVDIVVLTLRVQINTAAS